MLSKNNTLCVYREHVLGEKEHVVSKKNHIKLSMLTTLHLIARYHCTENVYDVFPLN